jgi:hypothetical protein
MNYYEPFIEKSFLGIDITKAGKWKSDVKVGLMNTTNVNFSVALFDTVFMLSRTVSEEQELAKALDSDPQHSLSSSELYKEEVEEVH